MSDLESCQDVPIGGICYVLQHCYRIKRLDMSRLQLAADYVIDPQPSSNSATVQFPNYWISKPEQSKRTVTFSSDTPKVMEAGRATSPHPHRFCYKPDPPPSRT